MEKLERYLDQVCRSLGGPRPMRQHVRQELREHLLDAVAQHKAAGASDEAALERALEEFGKPDDVRTELESAHGQRMMAVVIDKAMQWKEMTMKAKWLWTSWAYLALGLVIALEAFFIAFAVILIVPKFQKLMQDGLIDLGMMDEHGIRWMVNFLHTLSYVAGNNTLLLILLPAAAWGLFEWRVRSENKAFMRLSALGTVAVGLVIVVIVMSGSLLVCFCLAAPAHGRILESFALGQVSQIDQAETALDQATRAKSWEWESMAKQAEKIAQAVDNLRLTNSVIPALTRVNESPTAAELRDLLQSAKDDIVKMQQSIGAQNTAGYEAAMRSFHRAIVPFYQAAQRLKK